jgi:hypothetical protein
MEEDTLREISELDGCYALQTDLPAALASKELVHDCYKDLGMVAQDFRTMKTGLLKVRPLFVRTEANTRGYVKVVMLACLIMRELRRCWAGMDMTVAESLYRLSTLSDMTMIMPLDGAEVQQIPRPREESARLLAAAGVKLPAALPARGIRVVTRKKLPPQRKSI